MAAPIRETILLELGKVPGKGRKVAAQAYS